LETKAYLNTSGSFALFLNLDFHMVDAKLAAKVSIHHVKIQISSSWSKHWCYNMEKKLQCLCDSREERSFSVVL